MMEYERNPYDEIVCLRAELAALRAERDALQTAKDGAYLERNKCVALIARMAMALGYWAGTAKTAIEGWSEDWHGCVYIDLPAGQVSWHYHDSQAHLFDWLPPYCGEWDGHDTPEKYARVLNRALMPNAYGVREQRRAEKAEAELAALRAELESAHAAQRHAETELSQFMAWYAMAEQERGHQYRRAEKAEAEAARLRELLEMAAEYTRHPDYDWDIGFARDVRAALAQEGGR